MLISIIIPVYQVKDYIDKCIESVIEQTYQELEIILIDDGSTDGSGEICDEYAQKDNRINVIHKSNAGLSSARNVGLNIARGKYIAFIDSDDWVSRNFIQSMYEICEEYGADICQCGYYEAIDDIAVTEENGIPIIYTSLEFSYTEFSLLSWECAICWNKLYRASLFQKIRFPEGKIHEDEFTTYKVVNMAERIAVLPARLYYYRQRSDSIMGKDYSYKRLEAGSAYKERELFYQSNEYSELEKLTKARHLQWINGQISNFNSLHNRDIYIEGEAIKTRNMLVEELVDVKLLRNDFVRNQYVFPFDQVEKKSGIVLYGGGMIGQQYFLQIKATNYCNIELWVDKNFSKLRKIGIPVNDVRELRNHVDRCDYIVVALMRREPALEVIRMLQNEYKVDRSKIIYCLNAVVDINHHNNRID